MAQQFILSDGRSLDYVVLGDVSVTPVLWYHGTPGTYLPPPGLVETCQRYGLSVLAFSRPGYGSSSRQKGRKVIDTLSDTVELLKHYKIDKFYVAGWSGGGPYTLGTAVKLPGCLAALSVAGLAPKVAEGLDWLAGQGQDNVNEFEAGAKGEESLQRYVAPIRLEMLKGDLQGTMDALASVLPPVDAEALLSNRDLGQHFVDETKAAVEVTADGWVDDDLAFLQPWGFNVEDVKCPVIVYQGEVDAMVPFGHGKWITEHIPKDYIRSHLLEAHGHISVYLGNVDAMIQELVSCSKI